jgi:hypothetical protein
MILREYPFLSEYPQVVEIYKRLVKGDGPSSFMNINIQKGTACIDFENYNTLEKKKKNKR